MTPLVMRLVELFMTLRLGPRTGPDAIRDLLRLLAADAIQSDPASATVPTPNTVPPEVLEAIERGAAEVARLKAAGRRLHVDVERLPFATPSGRLLDRPTATVGPFVDWDGQLILFTVFESPSSAISVSIRSFVAPDEFVLQLPADSTPDSDDLHAWTLAPGTVWVRARFLAPGAEHFAGLRIASGSLTFAGAAPITRDHDQVFAPPIAAWTLTVVPESASANAGSDAAALTITPPERIVITVDGPPVLTGTVVVSGFGGDLACEPAAGPAVITDGVCLLPLTAPPGSWIIDGNRSTLAQWSGDAHVVSAAWALPIAQRPTGALPEAPHAGSLVAQLTGDIRGTIAGFTGQPFTLFVAMLIANACRLEVEGLQLRPGGRADFALWPTSRTRVVFAQQTVAALRFRSVRDRDDAIGIRGGRQDNDWDAPRQSSGAPFRFERADIDAFGLVGWPSDPLVTCLSHRSLDPAEALAGIALENAYVVVRQPQRGAVTAAVDVAVTAGPTGLAFLFLDGRDAIPTLPDPYATNLALDRSLATLDTFPHHLRIALDWLWSRPPVVTVGSREPLRMVGPHLPIDELPESDAIDNAWRRSIESRGPRTLLLDLSTREHLFGVAIEDKPAAQATPADPLPVVAHFERNRLTVPLHSVRLFMQPQVHWEPVWAQPNPDPLNPILNSGRFDSKTTPGLDLVAAEDPRAPVAVLPTVVTQGILAAARSGHKAAALFSLPFGMRGVALLNQSSHGLVTPGAVSSLHDPDFGRLRAAQQLRLEARRVPPHLDDPSRSMPGAAVQTENLRLSPLHEPNPPPVPSQARNSVLASKTVLEGFNKAFASALPLHRADLSGYGLSMFSAWHVQPDDPGLGVVKVQFEVINGRTAYEVIQLKARLWECGARVVRTVTMERHNSAAVVLTDSGWIAVEDGTFVPTGAAGFNAKIENGLVKKFSRIRRIRTTGRQVTLTSKKIVDEVVFDADAVIDTAGRAGEITVPLLNRPGYIHLPDSGELNEADLAALFAQVGAISSPIDATVTLCDTWSVHLTAVASDTAPNDAAKIGFAVAANGSPQLPRAGQWSAVRIDPATKAAFAIDERSGVPFVRRGGGDILVRDPIDALRTTAQKPYGLMMSTQASRALFPSPHLTPGGAAEVRCDAPSIADPYSLVQTTSAFPPVTSALGLDQAATFKVANDAWQITPKKFTAARLTQDLLNGSDWSFARDYPTLSGGEKVTLDIDSVNPIPWNIEVPPAHITLALPSPLDDLFTLKGAYQAASASLPTLPKPSLEFIGPLKELKNIVDALNQFADLGFAVNVDVLQVGSGTAPAFLVQIGLAFLIGKPEERIDIGVGKFFGQINLDGAFEVGTSGISKAPRLGLAFKGDIQQGIIPPLIYAGGLFRFAITVPPEGRPTIELALGVVASIGGDLIPGLVAVEVTVHYGYLLVPETLKPGVLLGLDARAKLLSGLVGFSFGVEAMARIERVTLSDPEITIWAHIRVAGSVQVAWLIEEDVDFETQFEQTLPLELATLAVGGVGLAGLLPIVGRL